MVTKHIKQFYFVEAKYRIDDGALLAISYSENDFKIIGNVSDKIKEEAENIARDLLSRKHNVNFAEHEAI